MYTKDDKPNTNTGSTTPAQPDRGFPNSQNSGRTFAGIIVLVIGSVFLARQTGVDIPGWVLSIGTLLIAIGLYMGFRQRFRNWVWMIPTGIGVLFLADRLIDGFSISAFIWPIIIIAVGLVLIFKPKKTGSDAWKNWRGGNDDNNNVFAHGDDTIDATAIFGAVKKNIISKNFRGGEVTAIFGGAEIYLGQADLNGRADLELTHVFGGAKIVVPADWRVQTDEVVCIFGGLDDKRKNITAGDPNKVLVLHGTCIFGGIDIKSY
jgi:predicted membrane protein